MKNAGLTAVHHNKQTFPLTIGTQKLPAGGYHFATPPRGLHIEPENFSVGKGETVEIKVRYVPPRTPPPIVVVKADEAKRIQQEWAAFLKRGKLDVGGASLEQVCAFLNGFLMPPTQALVAGETWARHWPAGGPWSETASP